MTLIFLTTTVIFYLIFSIGLSKPLDDSALLKKYDLTEHKETSHVRFYDWRYHFSSSRTLLNPITDAKRSYEVSETSRVKRSSEGDGTVVQGVRVFYGKTEITWRLLENSRYIPSYIVKYAINRAFRIWAEVIPLQFREDTTSDITTVDIPIAFGYGQHLACPIPFDGKGGAIAHSWHGGAIHLDDDEIYSFPSTSSSLDIIKVLMHEIGHVLGLKHINRAESIMYSIYSNPVYTYHELDRPDRTAIQSIFGVCKGETNVIFDWVRLKNGNYVYNTFIFREDNLWLYENGQQRPRYGDPIAVNSEFSSFPTGPSIDAVVQYKPKTADSRVFVFAGEMVYEFNAGDMSAVAGFPKVIDTFFSGFGIGVVDTAYYDPRDNNIYLIKGWSVYIFSLNVNGATLISTVQFPIQFPNDLSHQQTLNNPLIPVIDAAYYAIGTTASLFFVRGENVYKVITFDASSSFVYNRVQYYAKVWQVYYDLCDV